MNSKIASYLHRVKQAIDLIDVGQVEKLVDLLLTAREKGSFIYIFGNGGSSATASHVAGDFLKGISYQLDKGFKIVSLNDNMPGFSAIANDLDYPEVFIEQLKVYLTPKDLVIGISGSGNSLNVVKALEYAKTVGATTVAICGFKGGKIKQIADYAVHIPVNDMEITEDLHIIVFHAIKQRLIHQLKGGHSFMGEKYEQRIKQQ